MIVDLGIPLQGQFVDPGVPVFDGDVADGKIG